MNSEANNRRWCSFCLKVDGHYSCPRCGRFYCSVNCYNCKDHLVCTEEFNKKNVEDELRLRYLESKEDDNQVKRYTYEVLKRELEKRKDDASDDRFGNGFEGEIDGEIDYETLYDMLKESDQIDNLDELDENYDSKELKELMTKFGRLHLQKSTDLWNELNEEEKKNFESLLKQNQIFNLLPLASMSPWYLQMKSNASSSNLIEEINDKELNENEEADCRTSSKDNEKRVTFRDQSDNEAENKTRDEFIKELEHKLIEHNLKVPKIDIEIVKLSDLTKTKPSDAVKCLVMNLLFSYCHICRYFNNDHLLTPGEAYRLLNCLCPLSEKSAFLSTREAIQFPVQYLINEKKSKLEYILLLIDDLKFVVDNSERIYLNIMCDLIALVNRHLDLLKRKLKKQTNSDLENRIKSAKQVKRKLNYYLCYLNEHREEMINELNEIEIEKIYISKSNRSLNESKDKDEIKFY